MYKRQAAKEKAVELKHQNEKLNAVLDLEKPSALTEEECKLLIQYLDVYKRQDNAPCVFSTS